MADQGFDVDAARKAGYSDDEILQHLTQTRKFDVQKAVTSGYSKTDIINHLASMTPPQQGVLSRVWQAVNTPIADFVLPKDIKTGDLIKAALFEKAGLGQYVPGVNDEHTVAQQHLGDTPTKAALKTFVAGTLGDTGNTVASLTSPLSAGLLATGPVTKAAGAVGKVARAVQGASAAGFAGKGAADIAEAGTENTPEAWQQRLQGGAMLAGGAAGAAEAAKPTVQAAAARTAESLRESAITQYQKALNPTKERTKFLAQKRTPEMLQREITAKSPAALAERAGTEASAATKQLNDIYESLPGDRSSPTAPMLKALEEYKSQFQDRLPVTEDQLRAEVAANKGQAPANIVQQPDGSLVKVVNIDDHAVAAAEAMQNVIQQYGDTISPKSMRKVRKIFDESVAKAGGYEGRPLAEGSLIDARREAASAIREQLAKDNPELVPLNKEINFWLDVQRIAKETAKRRVGQQGGLGVRIAQGAGATVGGYVGAQVGGPITAGAGAYLGSQIAGKLARITQSTQWRTVSAVTKNRLADALASGNGRLIDAQLTFIDKKFPPPKPAELPSVSGGSQAAGTASGAAQDTAFFVQAKQELPNASVSEQLRRAQQLKVQATAGEDELEQARRGAGFAYKPGEQSALEALMKKSKLKRDPKTGRLIRE